MKNNKQEILKKIQPIFRNVFNNKNLKITFNSSSQTIQQWDSLAQINLVIGIEKLMKIKFSISELASLENVDEMVNLIIKKNK